MHAVEAAGGYLPAATEVFKEAGTEGEVQFSGVGFGEGDSETALEACFVDETVVQGVQHVLGLGFRLREFVVILAGIGTGVDAADVITDGIGVE